MTTPSILPQATTPFMRALEQAGAVEPRIGGAVDLIRNIKGQRPAPFVPFLVYEFGLISLSPYMTSLYTLLDEGRSWQVERGTLASVTRALGWIESPGELAEPPTTRRWWNHYQVRFENLPPDDGAGLDRIAEALRLSVPMRSDFRRGSHVYDVPMMVLDRGRLDGAMLDTDSGIAVKANGPRWSFGRAHEIEHTLTEAEGLALGNWIEPVAEVETTWAALDIPWADATLAWTAEAPAQRRAALANWFVGKAPYVVFRDAEGDVIGYRRARACRRVRPMLSGEYSFGGAAYQAAENGERVYIEAMTGFHDADGVEAANAALVFDGVISGKPGALWLASGQLAGGTEIATAAVSIPLRKTVRERVKFMLRF